MQFADATFPLPPMKSEFKNMLMTDFEFYLSFACENNPDAIIANLRKMGVLRPDQNLLFDDLYNVLVKLIDMGRMKDVREALRVPVMPDAPGMTEEMLDGLIELEEEYQNSLS